MQVIAAALSKAVAPERRKKDWQLPQKSREADKHKASCKKEIWIFTGNACLTFFEKDIADVNVKGNVKF